MFSLCLVRRRGVFDIESYLHRDIFRNLYSIVEDYWISTVMFNTILNNYTL